MRPEQSEQLQGLALDRAGPSRARVRLRGAALAALCMAVLGVARWLQPRGAGYGTHSQLGLPDCAAMVNTGYPCPTCGMTTAVSLMAHGRPLEAVEAHPFGLALFLVLAAGAAVGAAELVSATDLLRFFRPGLWWLWLAGGGLLAGWGLKLAVGLACGRLPTH